MSSGGPVVSIVGEAVAPAPPCKRDSTVRGTLGGMGEDLFSGMTLVGVGQRSEGEMLVDPDGEEARDSEGLGR